nr:MAG TPA: hypothetical protein [Bacteriophage sp.]
MSYIPEPITRIDKYLAYIAGNMDVALPDHPITRKEHYLAAWAEKSGFEDVDVAGEPPLTLENGIGKPLKGLRIYGRSKQVTTTGAQLFPPATLGSQEKNGITVDCMEGGKIHISGTAETMVDFYVSRLQLPAGTYTFSAGVNIDASVLRYMLVTTVGVPYYDVNGDYTTDTIAETIDVSLLLRVYAGKTIDLTVKPMLNAGSTPLPWEPYTGGKPSPSPNYPQEIESVGTKWSTGANLLDISKWNTYDITYGLTMMIDEDGYFQLEGTYDNGAGAGNIGSCIFRFLRTSPGTVFPDGVKFAGGMMETSENVSNLRFLCTGLSENTPCLVIAFSAVNGENIKIRFRPILYVGDTTPDWEPYTGGIPKPYGDKIGVGVRGINLLDPAQAYQNNTSNYKMYKDGFLLKKGVTYTLSCYPITPEGLYINEWNIANNTAILAVTYGKNVLIYTPEQDKKVFFDYYCLNGLDPVTSKLMLEIGANDNPAYEPYHAPQSMSISTPNGLPGIPVSSGGNYTDADGQQWICDEIDFSRNVKTQRIKIVDMADCEITAITEFDNTKRLTGKLAFKATDYHYTALCNRSPFAANFTGDYEHFYVDEINAFLFIPISNALPQKGEYVIEFVLATPIETPLTDDQLAAYKQLHTYKGTTIIDNDAGAYMSVKYEKMK